MRELATGNEEGRDIVEFQCFLDDQPSALVSRPALAELKSERVANDLVLNPWCCLSSKDIGRPPFLERFGTLDDAVWLLDLPSNVLLFYELGKDFKRCLQSTHPGKSPPPDVPPRISRILQYARLLVPKDYVARRQKEWNATTAEQAAFLGEHGYVPLKTLLHPFQIASLRRYYRELIQNGEFSYDDDPESPRLWMHNEVATRYFHYQLTSTVSKIVGEPVQPSYSYICSYQSGACLPIHTDRDQCEYTISLCVDFVPEPESVTGWPLYVQAKDGLIVVQQALGDGLLFRGRELPHYRDALPAGCTSTSVFFHFVHRDFVGTLE